ncbi:hypothetical protein MN608_02323 [Microdochium nivale]|nr:hypothetical protein MN608_02323 [Microdochium nivale]
MEMSQYINPYGPDYQGGSSSFFQYELTPASDGSVSSATDLSSLDTLPSMPHSPFMSTASSEVDLKSFKAEPASIPDDLPGLSPSPDNVGLINFKKDCTSSLATSAMQAKQQAQLPYYNAPWDAHNSQKMMLVDGLLRDGSTTHAHAQESISLEMTNQSQAAMLQDAPLIMSSGQCTLGIQQQAVYVPMGTMSGSMPPWNGMIAGPQTMTPLQQMWSTSSCSNMPMMLHGDQSGLQYITPNHDGLPGATHPLHASQNAPYQFCQRQDQCDFSGQSVYPSPPSFEPPLEMASSKMIYESPRAMKREHSDVLARHSRHQSSSLRRARSNTPDRRYHLARTPSHGYSRKYHSETCSPESTSSAEDSDMEDDSTAIVVGGVERSARDKYLLKYRSKGWTYKEIREKGNFPEAESTLRGRYRTLTKEKDARVRKPEWQHNDIKLLKRGVRKLGKSASNGDVKKISWKQVAEYISQNGGSYSFGYATCRKRWDELVAQKEDGNASSD